jgi:phosphoribosylformylglycinamidine cyclo-ligase
LRSGKIKGLAHITGGGLLENIPRILPEGIGVEIKRGTWTELPIFGVLQKLGNVEDREMFRTFNMGLGMILICSGEDLSFFKNHLGEECREIGKVVAGKKEVFIK